VHMSTRSKRTLYRQCLALSLDGSTVVQLTRFTLLRRMSRDGRLTRWRWNDALSMRLCGMNSKKERMRRGKIWPALVMRVSCAVTAAATT
jgi:hypothetical protein